MRFVPDGDVLGLHLADTVLVNPLDNGSLLIGELLHVDFVRFEEFSQGAQHRVPGEQDKGKLVPDYEIVLSSVADVFFPDASRRAVIEDITMPYAVGLVSDAEPVGKRPDYVLRKSHWRPQQIWDEMKKTRTCGLGDLLDPARLVLLIDQQKVGVQRWQPVERPFHLQRSVHLHGTGEQRDDELAFPAGYLSADVRAGLGGRVQAACGEQPGRGISCRRPERFGEQPWVSSYVLAVDVQLLAYPQIRE